MFGFAITLLVVSLEVPKTFNDLVETMRGFGAFAISFALLFTVWFNQYKFFRRYGLKDNISVFLNATLLFVVLFYVYPLKFLFSHLVNRISGGRGLVRLADGTFVKMIEWDQMSSLMLIFGAGYLAVFTVFFLLYLHAYRQRDELELNHLERFDTRNSMQEAALNCGIALLSMAVILIGGPSRSAMAGIVYMLTGVAMGLNGTLMGKKRRILEKTVTQEFTPSAELSPN
ncbi:MAG TPA: TMEM175 family protein [Pyrinomonadaceae bacterium]